MTLNQPESERVKRDRLRRQSAYRAKVAAVLATLYADDPPVVSANSVATVSKATPSRNVLHGPGTAPRTADTIQYNSAGDTAAPAGD